ncbi:hypothetical protein [Lactobacillus crispatus]|jgi:hypothetical protein|uniref:Bacteriocin-type signal sequence n=1 Tax=Lactobacillus crispatus FB077-07 TaxID=883092 RepID=K1NU00_9LACO|nr:hypothetical protein [Lactobacillus crispatus]CPR64673.1 Uncharacterised protein [Chlamydia trachomatis]EFQ45255.1 bacteriocin-type signal sequence [Lactobacillus crispatus CTV-05]EKB62268.1 hypothetical protein HMPREF9250_00464 [Lactobacillus crispatus FB049-03]EKB71674.1 hypothetical protein HMPREF9249_00813 [Lactobacillus crispatus FB077-07]KFL93832.1 hypothetical protein HMPREF0509_00835 [Lactobacillus crispatus SJ-3C-US]
MKKLNEEELVEVKGGFAITNMVFNQNLFAMNNIVNKSKRPLFHFNWKKFLGLK